MKGTHGRGAADTIRDHFQTLDDTALDAHLAEPDPMAEEKLREIVACS